MKKVTIWIFGLVLLNLLVVSAQEHNFEEAERLIENRASCGDLTDSQLEAIGDYYMEQMHPGKAHELMDEMMGGEGSESLRDVHIRIAKTFYCGDRSAMSPGMMSIVMGRGGVGMMGTNLGYGMMGNSYYGMTGIGSLWWIIAILVIIALVLIIILLFKQVQKSRK